MADYATGYLDALEDLDDKIIELLETVGPNTLRVEDVQDFLHQQIDVLRHFLTNTTPASSGATPPAPETRSATSPNPHESQEDHA